MKKLFPFIFIVLLLTACSTPTPKAAPTAKPETTEVLTSTETATPEPTTKPTPTQAPTPTPEPTIDQKAQAELNQQIQDFINFEGEFSEEYMIANGLLFTDMDYNPMKFGIYRYDQPDVAAWLFDSIRINGNDWVIVGFDGKDGERFVTVVKFPTYLSVELKSGLSISSRSGTAFRSEYLKQATLMSSEEIYDFFQEVKGSPIKIGFYTRPENDFSIYGDFENEAEQVLSRVGLVNRVFKEVSDNGFKNVEGLYPKTIEDGTKLVRIERVEDINALSVEQIPYLSYLGYIEQG